MKRRIVSPLVLPALCLAAILVAWTGALGGGPAASPGERGGFGGAIAGPGAALRVGLSLALILFLILGAGWVFRRFVRREDGTHPGKLRVIDRCFLAPKRALYTVRLGDRVVIVGVTETAITPVLDLTREEVGKLYPEPGPEPVEGRASFSGILSGLLSKVSGPPAERRAER